ncbi:hypothetical protein D3C86_1885830 [compost metagenome]
MEDVRSALDRDLPFVTGQVQRAAFSVPARLDLNRQKGAVLRAHDREDVVAVLIAVDRSPMRLRYGSRFLICERQLFAFPSDGQEVILLQASRDPREQIPEVDDLARRLTG